LKMNCCAVVDGVQTSVISETLNGKKRKLKMDGGTSDQVDCLSNADAYVPSADMSTDVASILQYRQVHCLCVSVLFVYCHH